MIQRAPKLRELESLGEPAECLKSLAHPCRLRLMQLLSQGEHTVGELAASCQIPSPTVSEHLKLLRDRGLLRKDRDGRNVYYRIAHERVGVLLQFVETYFPPENVAAVGSSEVPC